MIIKEGSEKNLQKVPLWNFLLSSNIWAPDCFQLHSITLQHSSCLLTLFLDALSSLAHLYQNRKFDLEIPEHHLACIGNSAIIKVT